jgi:hypothetical protein
MSFFEVTYRQKKIAQIQAVCGKQTVPFRIRQTTAVTPR